MKVVILSLVLSFGSLSFARISKGVKGVKENPPVGSIADKPVPVEDAIKLLKSFSSKTMPVVVKGNIGAVCQAKGCWLTLKPSNHKKESDVCTETLRGASSQADVRVMFGDHAFEVPKDLKGTVTVHGEMKKKKLSSFQLKHLLKDAGCSKSQMKKAKKGLYKYQIVANAVYHNNKKYSAK